MSLKRTGRTQPNNIFLTWTGCGRPGARCGAWPRRPFSREHCRFARPRLRRLFPLLFRRRRGAFPRAARTRPRQTWRGRTRCLCLAKSECAQRRKGQGLGCRFAPRTHIKSACAVLRYGNCRRPKNRRTKVQEMGFERRPEIKHEISPH